MRNVASIAFADLRPADLAGHAEPMFDRLAPSDLLVDETYQRGLSRRSEKLIRAIVEGWDWLKFKPPVVALTEVGFEVVDGQHTAIAAACHPGISTIPIIVVDGSDLPRRARAFVAHAVNRLQASPVDVWHAAVAGGDEGATVIRDVLGRAGVVLLRHNPDDNIFHPRQTLALGAIRALVARRGPEQAYGVLRALVCAELAPIEADHVKVAEALLCDEEYAGVFDRERVMSAFCALSPKLLAEARELAAAKRLPTWRALTATMYRRFASRRIRARAARMVKAPASRETSNEDRTPALAGAPARAKRERRIGPPVRTFDALGHIVQPFPELAAVVGAGPMLRSDAITALSKYIEVHGLNDPGDRRIIVADTKLRAVFGKDRVRVSELGHLFSPPSIRGLKRGVASVRTLDCPAPT